METANKTINIVCDECKESFDSKKIKLQKQIIEIEGTPLQLTFYDCPLCGKRYDVLIGNQETLRVKRNTDSLAKKLQSNARKRKVPTEYQVNKMLIAQIKLKKLYDDLFNQFNLSFYQSGDVKQQLNITIPKVHSEETIKGENNNV